MCETSKSPTAERTEGGGAGGEARAGQAADPASTGEGAADAERRTPEAEAEADPGAGSPLAAGRRQGAEGEPRVVHTVRGVGYTARVGE